MLSIYAASKQYVTVPITNNEGINPTSDVVQFAFLGPASTVPQANDLIPDANTTYFAGFWQNDTSPYNAAILVGAGSSVPLTSGAYLVIVKITDSPEIPCLFSGPMVVN